MPHPGYLPPVALAVPLSYDIPRRSLPPKIAVVSHLFYEDLFPLYRSAFASIPFPCDVFISTGSEENRALLEELFSDWLGNVRIVIVPNRGRDIAPKLVTFGREQQAYDYVLHFHTKKQVREHGLEKWRDHFFAHLLGSEEVVRSIIHVFDQIPSLGIVAGAHFAPVERWIGWGENLELARALLRRMGMSVSDVKRVDFPSGSMFWARPAALKPLFDLSFSLSDFPDELGQTDGTLAHAIERLFYLACEKSGYSWLTVKANPTSDAFRPRSSAELRWGWGKPTRKLYRPSALRCRMQDLRLNALEFLR